MRPMPAGTPVAMAMTPQPGARPPLGPGATPVGKERHSNAQYDEVRKSTVLVLWYFSKFRYPGHGRDTKSDVTGMNNQSSCL